LPLVTLAIPDRTGLDLVLYRITDAGEKELAKVASL
jgi:hypothetical protein